MLLTVNLFLLLGTCMLQESVSILCCFIFNLDLYSIVGSNSVTFNHHIRKPELILRWKKYETKMEKNIGRVLRRLNSGRKICADSGYFNRLKP